MTSRIFLFLLALPLVASGCASLSTPTTPSVTADKNLEIEAFAARGFLGGTDYEQYKLASGVMWRECGTVLGKGAAPKEVVSEKDNVFRPDTSLQPLERRVEELTREELTLLTTRALELLRVSKTSSEKIPAPGSLFSLSQPGLVEISLVQGGEKQRFITSVDAVANGELPVTKELHNLFGAVRSIGKTICNANSFYGIRRK